jgi:hypothetical protein
MHKTTIALVFGLVGLAAGSRLSTASSAAGLVGRRVRLAAS